MSAIDQGTTCGFFDGVSQGLPPLCGVKVVFHLNHNHYIHARYVLGRRSNNKAKLIALRSLLTIAQEKGVERLHIFGNSKLVIDWACTKVIVEKVCLGPLLQHLKYQMILFEWLCFQYIYRELNSKDDSLSKEALMLPKEAFEFYKFIDGEDTDAME
jgi:ribonuclease HI